MFRQILFCHLIAILIVNVHEVGLFTVLVLPCGSVGTQRPQLRPEHHVEALLRRNGRNDVLIQWRQVDTLTSSVDAATLLQVDIHVKVVLHDKHLALAHLVIWHLGGGNGVRTCTYSSTGIDENNV